jgi:poly(3-hydroxybutyrate) depolymerase
VRGPRPTTVSALLAAVLLAGGLATAGPPAPAAARGAGKVDAKALEALATAWAKARPKTRFEEWDGKAREDLLAQARALGPIPEGSLDEVRDVLWRAIKKHPPAGPNAAGRLATPYGEARWIENGRGGGKSGLVMGLHGGGEGAGDASEAAGTWNVPGCLGMYPQGIRLVHDTWNTVHGERFVLTLLDVAKVQREVDPDRVVAAGFSMGGTGSWFLAGRHPDLLAAAAPCVGVLMASPKSQVPKKEDVQFLQYGFVPNVRNLAMTWFAGLADDHCMPGTYLCAWDLLQDLRRKDAGGYERLRFTTYEGLGHAFPPGEPGKIIAWLATQRREPFPSRLVWEYAADPFPLPEDDVDRRVGRYVKRDFYWLHTERPEDKSTVRATLDRSGATNAFTLELGGTAPEDWTVWMSPKSIDVAKDVVVVADGQEVYRGRPVPDVATVFETLDSRLDRTLTFDRRVRLAPPK